jgi:hypothetical protein
MRDRRHGLAGHDPAAETSTRFMGYEKVQELFKLVNLPVYEKVSDTFSWQCTPLDDYRAAVGRANWSGAKTSNMIYAP